VASSREHWLREIGGSCRIEPFSLDLEVATEGREDRTLHRDDIADVGVVYGAAHDVLRSGPRTGRTACQLSMLQHGFEVQPRREGIGILALNRLDAPQAEDLA
jgi:hypothetical protein